MELKDLSEKFFIICGPNVIESEEHTMKMAKMLKEKFDDNLNYLRIIGKRENGKLSNREQIINLIRLSYINSKTNNINLNEFYKKNTKLSCKDIYTKLSELKTFNLSFQKVNLTNFSEKILLMIEKIRFFITP